MRRAVLLALLLAAAANVSAEDDSATTADDVVARGEYLLHAGGCISCHQASEEKGAPLSGGRALDSPFGRFFAPNITPDVATGIGAWTDEEFIAAFRHGRSPDGDNYYPAFPYPAYTGISDDDLMALKAYLDSVEPVSQPNQPHELTWFVRWRALLGMWNALYLDDGAFEADPNLTETINRGAYLVKHLGHCGECHSPRGELGAPLEEAFLAGNPEGPEGDVVPSITNDDDNGIGKWTVDDIAFFLEIGMLPDGDFAGASMSEVIDHNTGRLSSEDRLAIAEYLKTVE
jgi:mono/diheme cytochrome c family protein